MNMPTLKPDQGLKKDPLALQPVDYGYGSHTPSQGNSWLLAAVPLLLLTGLLCFTLWAAFFEIDESVRARGQLIPLARTQVVQVADGGVLAELKVNEGDRVKAGQTLALLETERVNAAFEDSRAKVAAIKTALIRARAESEEKPLNYADSFTDFHSFVDVQKALYAQRKQGLEEQLNSLQQSLAITRAELGMNRSLYKTGDISRLELMRTQRQLAELQGKYSAAKNKYLEDARKEVAKLEAELAAAEFKLIEQKYILEHAEVIAPVEGVVKYLKVNTLGGVLRSGDELMQILPTNGELVAEVRIDPVDVGQLHTGLPVSVKLDAFDYSIYGSLPGTLSYLSADTLTEQTEEGQSVSYYRAQVAMGQPSPSPSVSDSSRKQLTIKPGMTVQVDIRTNRRSVLDYLAKPVMKVFSNAFNER